MNQEHIKFGNTQLSLSFSLLEKCGCGGFMRVNKDKCVEKFVCLHPWLLECGLLVNDWKVVLWRGTHGILARVGMLGSDGDKNSNIGGPRMELQKVLWLYMEKC